MVEITAVYEGGLRCSATHAPSGAQLATDAPVDNCGKGESFSPTDLAATSLGVCMMTVMSIYAEKHGIDLGRTTARILKEMTPEPPRRIAKLTVEIAVPLDSDHSRREAIERVAMGCPVFLSLHPDIEKAVTFTWG